MNKAILFTGRENDKEFYQLLIGSRCVIGIRNVKGLTSLEDSLNAISDKIASALIEESSKNNESYLIFTRNGQKLKPDYVNNRTEIVEIGKLKDSVIHSFSVKLNNKLNELVKGLGYSLSLDQSSN